MSLKKNYYIRKDKRENLADVDERLQECLLPFQKELLHCKKIKEKNLADVDERLQESLLLLSLYDLHAEPGSQHGEAFPVCPAHSAPTSCACALETEKYFLFVENVVFNCLRMRIRKKCVIVENVVFTCDHSGKNLADQLHQRSAWDPAQVTIFKL